MLPSTHYRILTALLALGLALAMGMGCDSGGSSNDPELIDDQSSPDQSSTDLDTSAQDLADQDEEDLKEDQADTEESDTEQEIKEDQSGDIAIDEDSAEDQAEVVTPTVPVGAACTGNDDCNGGLCILTLPGGYCSQACDTDPELCPAGSVCSIINNFPFCMESCSGDSCRSPYQCVEEVCDIECREDSDCGASEVCNDYLCEPTGSLLALGDNCTASAQCESGYCLHSSKGGICSEECPCSLSSWNCEMTVTAEAAARELCVPHTTTTGLEVITLVGGNPRTFEVDSNVVSFLIVAESNEPDGYVWIESLTKPNGSVIAGEMQSTGFTEPMRLTLNAGHGSALVPQSSVSAHQPMAGQWSFDVVDYSGAGIDKVRVFLKKADGTVNTGQLDLNVFIAPNLNIGLTASSAPTHSGWNSALNRMRNSYWQEHGLTVGDINYFDMNSSAYTVIDSDEELHQMFASESAYAPADGPLNIFLVRELDLQDSSGHSGSAVGIAGGIPGPIGLRGNGGSGVVIMMSSSSSSNEIGDIMAHEVGHYLGFYHNTEIGTFDDGQQINDVIADTPSCDSPAGDIYYFDDCMTNVMFPIVVTGWGIDQEFTNTQGLVMRLNPRAE